jgi:hypothetical protein
MENQTCILLILQTLALAGISEHFCPKQAVDIGPTNLHRLAAITCVTHNVKDFRRVEELNVQVATPAEILNLLRSKK